MPLEFEPVPKRRDSEREERWQTTERKKLLRSEVSHEPRKMKNLRKGECISAAQICLLIRRINCRLACELIDPQHLNHDHEDPDAEVDGAQGFRLGNGGQGHAAL